MEIKKKWGGWKEEKTIQEANEKNKKRDVFNKFSKEIKVVE